MAFVRACARVLAILSAAAGLVAPAGARAEGDLVSLFVERFPEVMNATLIERDCPGFRREAQRELSYYADAFIHFADGKPELAGGVDAVYRAGAAYDKQHYAAGASFCGKYAAGIVDRGLESARAMAPEVGLALYDPKTVDLPVLEKSLEGASELIGAADKCREVRRDTYAGVAGRHGGFMFFSSTVGEIKIDFTALKDFAVEHGSKDLAGRLDTIAKRGHETGPDECSLSQYVTLGSDLEALVKRYGLTP